MCFGQSSVKLTNAAPAFQTKNQKGHINVLVCTLQCAKHIAPDVVFKSSIISINLAIKLTCRLEAELDERSEDQIIKLLLKFYNFFFPAYTSGWWQ